MVLLDIPGGRFYTCAKPKLHQDDQKEDFAMTRFMTIMLFVLFMVSVIALGGFSATYDPAAGKATYDASCAMCHKTGMMGAPKTGDKKAWKPHIAKGTDALVANAIKGYKGTKGMMPAKGGNTKLTNAQVGNAVAYMEALSK